LTRGGTKSIPPGGFRLVSTKGFSLTFTGKCLPVPNDSRWMTTTALFTLAFTYVRFTTTVLTPTVVMFLLQGP
jgi:hypothetical protein